MLTTPLNQKTITVKLKRIEICDLLIACTAIGNSLENDGKNAKKWNELHDKLESILNEFDEKQEF